MTRVDDDVIVVFQPHLLQSGPDLLEGEELRTFAVGAVPDDLVVWKKDCAGNMTFVVPLLLALHLDDHQPRITESSREPFRGDEDFGGGFRLPPGGDKLRQYAAESKKRMFFLLRLGTRNWTH